MKHKPLIEYNDGLVLTYSELKKDKRTNEEYITLYLEKPNMEKTDFNSAEYICPADKYDKVYGFEMDYLLGIENKVKKMGNHALSWAKEDAHAETV